MKDDNYEARQYTGGYLMHKGFVAIAAVSVVILISTVLLSGTGILVGFSGMFFRVLIGFATVFCAMKVFGRWGQNSTRSSC